MENYLQITFDKKPKKLKEAILLVVNESAGEHIESVDLFETKQNKTGFTVELPQAYDDNESDKLAEQIANKLFDDGYNNFDIEVFSTLYEAQNHDFLNTIVDKYNKPNLTRADVQAAEREAKATQPSGDGLIGGFKRFAINESYRVKYVLGHLASKKGLPGLYNSRGNFCYLDEAGEAAASAGGSLDQLLALARAGLSPESKVAPLADRFRRYENATSGQGQATWQKVQEIIRLHRESMAGPTPSPERTPAQQPSTPAEPDSSQPINRPYNPDSPFLNISDFLTHDKGGLANDREYTEAVKELQAFLKDKGMYDGEIDGRYGPQTIDAVKEYQRENNLTVDGDAGPETLRHMMNPNAAIQTRDGERMSDEEALQAFVDALQENDYATALRIADEYPSVKDAMQEGHYELLQQRVNGSDAPQTDDTPSADTDEPETAAPSEDDLSNIAGQGFSAEGSRYTVEMAKTLGASSSSTTPSPTTTSREPETTIDEPAPSTTTREPENNSGSEMPEVRQAGPEEYIELTTSSTNREIRDAIRSIPDAIFTVEQTNIRAGQIWINLNEFDKNDNIEDYRHAELGQRIARLAKTQLLDFIRGDIGEFSLWVNDKNGSYVFAFNGQYLEPMPTNESIKYIKEAAGDSGVIVFVGKKRTTGSDSEYGVYAVDVATPKAYEIDSNTFGIYRSRATRLYDRINVSDLGEATTLSANDVLYKYRELLLGNESSNTQADPAPEPEATPAPEVQTDVGDLDDNQTGTDDSEIETPEPETTIDGLSAELDQALQNVEDDAPFEFQGTPVDTRDNAAGITDEYEDAIMRAAEEAGIDTTDRDPVEIAAEVIDGVENPDRVNATGITAPATAGNGIPADFNMQWQSVSEMVLNEEPHTEVRRAFGVAIDMLNKNVLTPSLRSLVMQEIADPRRYAEFQDDFIQQVLDDDSISEDSKRNFRLIMDFKAALRGDVSASQRIGLQLPLDPDASDPRGRDQMPANPAVARGGATAPGDIRDGLRGGPSTTSPETNEEYIPSNTVIQAVNDIKNEMQRRKRRNNILTSLGRLSDVNDFEYLISEMGEDFLDDLIELFDDNARQTPLLRRALEPLGYEIEETDDFWDPYRIVKAETDETN